MTRRDANAVAKGRFLDRKAQKPRLACRWSPTPEKRFRTVCLTSAHTLLRRRYTADAIARRRQLSDLLRQTRAVLAQIDERR
jgi:hypothetical protein